MFQRPVDEEASTGHRNFIFGPGSDLDDSGIQGHLIPLFDRETFPEQSWGLWLLSRPDPTCPRLLEFSLSLFTAPWRGRAHAHASYLKTTPLETQAYIVSSDSDQRGPEWWHSQANHEAQRDSERSAFPIAAAAPASSWTDRRTSCGTRYDEERIFRHDHE